ncbi:MAG: YitT family protein [Bianqueaceae bacterium]
MSPTASLRGVTGIESPKELSERFLPVSIPLYLSNFVINIPLLIIALVIKGRAFLGRTCVATILLSLFLFLTQKWAYDSGDMILNILYGGILSGAGIGLVFTASATTGGTDLIAAIISHYHSHLSIPYLLFFVDAVIVLSGIFVFDVSKAMYAVVGIFLTSHMANRVMEGFHYSKAIFIISDCWEVLADTILKELQRGVTGLSSQGMYTRKDRKMLFCVVSSKEIVRIKEIVAQKDAGAFLIVTDVREVFGEGFVEYSNS